MRRGIILIIGAAIFLLGCTFPYLPTFSSGSSLAKTTGRLTVDVNYAGQWYVDTFNYSREAPNIKHFVFVVPENQAGIASAATLVHNVWFPEHPGDPWMPDELSWAEPYLHEAPNGYFTGEFEPGLYEVTGFFIAGPISAEEAGVEPGTLYAGVTGGGASVDTFQTIQIRAGQTVSVQLTLLDRNGWACPWLSVFNGTEYERRTEILRNIRDVEQTEETDLGAVPVVNGGIDLRISEEKPETTYLDQIYLIVNGVNIPTSDFHLSDQDDQRVVLGQGMTLDLRFDLPEDLKLLDTVNVTVIAAGYYVP